ncbi:MAG TPA: glycoside hydrolase family 13 protein [Saprospiraceae bacterium]|nr:glycoside hydrolase family 13 protein [Saprospiraceae bacterium]
MKFKILSIIVLTTTLSIGQNQSKQVILRVDPPNWWVGMADSSLQIMIYGPEISSFDINLKYPGVELIKTTRVENPNYIFIDLVVNRDCKAGSIPIKLKNKNITQSIDYQLYKRETLPIKRGVNSSDVIYLITPDRFSNSDPGNDNIAGYSDLLNRNENLGRHGGDLEGISNHLDYISNMGFTAVWLNPVLENNMPQHSYHGYAITDYYRVDPRYGSNESYKKFCADASRHNIKVIMDMVVNHCGLSHWWMNDLPTADWINYQDKPYTQTNHRKTISTDPYVAIEDEKIMTEGWFVRTMPDLNITNPLLAKYMIQNSIWWIEYAGLSGIRMDTYPYPNENYMSEWSHSILNEYPDFHISGEVWHDDPAIVSYWQKGKINPNDYVSWLPSLFDFPMQSALNKSLMPSSDWEDDWMPLYDMLAKDFLYADPQQLIVFADNHDMSRIFTQVDENYENYKMAIAYVLTSRGIPQVYYGTEILMSNKGKGNHGVIRSDFPGGWSGDTINAFNGKGLMPLQKNAQDFFKKLLSWRKDEEVIHHGKTMHFIPEKKVYVVFRYNDQKTVMLILNKNESSINLNLDRFKSILGNANQGIDVMTGEKIILGSELTLNNAGPMIIEIDK